jgi:demethylmenaquinone methyltransferase/2-methoxy-6-polyprenyl-1,4-benzoquinol methylase
MEIINQKEYFNEQYKEWINSVDENKLRIMKESIRLLNISKEDCILDVACGTGVLYPLLMSIPVKTYTAIDISEKMLEEFSRKYSNVEMKVWNFERPIILKEKFDFIIIFNSIPHFEDLDSVFLNAKNNLKQGGKLSVIHTRTREGIYKHHRKIRYNIDRDAIPKDDILNELCYHHNFQVEKIIDDDFFFFSCEKI